MARRLVDGLIAMWLIAIVAFFVTGGGDLSVAGIHVRSHRLSSLLGGLSLLVALRVAFTVGIANTVTLFVSTMLALGIGEIVVRRLVPASDGMAGIHRPSDVYGWELVPSASAHGPLGERIEIDSEGLRDVDRPIDRAAFRIAVVGDSFTFGMGVDLEDTYAKRLEAALRTRNPYIEVKSFGVVAYQLWQLVRVIEHRVAPYRPDLVLIGFFYDDLVAPSPPAGDLANNPFEAEALGSSRLLQLARHGYRAIGTRFRTLGGTRYLASIDVRRDAIASGTEYDLYYRAQAGLLDDGAYAAARVELERIAAWSREHSIPVLAALIPDSSQLHDPERQAANRWFAETLAHIGIPFHDLTPLFEADPDPRSLYLLPHDAHTSQKANRMIGNALAADSTVAACLQTFMAQGPSTRSPSRSPGHGGIVTATTTSASADVPRT